MISKAQLEKIRRIIARNYSMLAVGRNLSLAYFHNLLNEGKSGPQTIKELEKQLKGSTIIAKPTHGLALEHMSENLEALIEKQRMLAQASVEGVLRDYNLDARNRMLQGLESSGSISQIKTKLQDISGDAGRKWAAVVNTEVANSVGMGSIDRVVENNQAEDLNEVYVFRIPVVDSALCVDCRRFYLDDDGSPAVYRLSTLLANGSNYGRKRSAWLPVANATHVNDRETGVIQIRRGWKVLPGGRLDFVGNEGWDKYMVGKVRG